MPSNTIEMTEEASKNKQLVQHAQGFLELGMFNDAWDELEKIEPGSRARTAGPVMKLRLRILMEAKKWEEAVMLGPSICKQWPDDPSPFITLAYCLHELKRTQEAKDTLLSGPEALKSEVLFHYNLGCYEAQLGNIEAAQECVKKAIDIDPSLKASVINDPDLEPIKKYVC